MHQKTRVTLILFEQFRDNWNVSDEIFSDFLSHLKQDSIFIK